MKNIIFIAPPAAGKGTQSNMLKEKYEYIHISTGDLLRSEIASGSVLGLEIKNIIDKGNLVSDDLMIDIINSKLTEIKGKPFILDGFPRTLNQALALEEILDDDYKVIYLDLDKDEAIKRIMGRLTCSCGMSYNLNDEALKPKQEGICDNCGKILVKRDDDNVDAFIVRYDNFLNNTKVLIDYYNDKNKLSVIDANKNIEDIFNDISMIANIETYKQMESSLASRSYAAKRKRLR